MNGAEVFFDTNVFAHAQDHDVPDKRERSRQLIADVVATDTGVVSAQVLHE
jgi:predicted nucleic acid-binding protein